MSPCLARRAATAVCVAAIVGMIVSAVNESTAGALTAGMVAAAAALAMILVTAVTADGAPGVGVSPVDESLAAEIEDRVRSLVAMGADEAEVRELVGAAVRLGRRRRRAGSPGPDV